MDRALRVGAQGHRDHRRSNGRRAARDRRRAQCRRDPAQRRRAGFAHRAARPTGLEGPPPAARRRCRRHRRCPRGDRHTDRCQRIGVPHGRRRAHPARHVGRATSGRHRSSSRSRPRCGHRPGGPRRARGGPRPCERWRGTSKRRGGRRRRRIRCRAPSSERRAAAQGPAEGRPVRQACQGGAHRSAQPARSADPCGAVAARGRFGWPVGDRALIRRAVCARDPDGGPPAAGAGIRRASSRPAFLVRAARAAW